VKLKDLKAGDQVFMSQGDDYIVKTVEKITPKGFIKVDGRLFNQDGIERCSGYHWKKILPINDETMEKVRRVKHDLAIKNRAGYLNQVNWRTMPEDLITETYNKVRQFEKDKEVK
jgi:hypothetical protein